LKSFFGNFQKAGLGKSPYLQRDTGDGTYHGFSWVVSGLSIGMIYHKFVRLSYSFPSSLMNLYSAST